MNLKKCFCASLGCIFFYLYIFRNVILQYLQNIWAGLCCPVQWPLATHGSRALEMWQAQFEMWLLLYVQNNTEFWRFGTKNAKCLSIIFMLITCWNDNILDILGYIKYIKYISGFFVFCFYFFNVATKNFLIVYVVPIAFQSDKLVQKSDWSTQDSHTLREIENHFQGLSRIQKGSLNWRRWQDNLPPEGWLPLHLQFIVLGNGKPREGPSEPRGELWGVSKSWS